MKTCSTCKVAKSRLDFEVRSDTGCLRLQCRGCVNIRIQKLRLRKIKVYRQRAIERYYRNLAARRKYAREWRKQHPDKGREWVKTHPESVLKTQRKHLNKKYRENPNFRMACNLRSRINMALRGVGFKKSGPTFSLLGCSVAELRTYLESHFKPGMTWENHGPVWHVDHKRPCAWFDLTDPLQQRVCFHWTNLQPLFAKENLAKGAS